MSALDDELSRILGNGAIPSANVPSSVRAPQPGLDDELDSILSAGRQPSFGERAASLGGDVLHGVGAVVGAPKRAEDALIRASARNLYGLDVPDDATSGQLVRQGAGLDPRISPESDTYGGRLAGKALEFSTDVLTDPLTPVLAGSGSAVRGGQLAERVLARAGGAGELAPKVAEALERAVQIGGRVAPVEKAAQVGFGTLMATGAAQEAADTYAKVREQGLSPEAAEAALGTLASAYFAGHIAHGLHEAPAVAADPFAAFNGAEARPVAERVAPERPAPQPAVDVAAERAFLTPDRLAEYNAQLARDARAEQQPLADAIKSMTDYETPGPRLGPKVPPLTGEGDAFTLSPDAGAVARGEAVERPATAEPNTALLMPDEPVKAQDVTSGAPDFKAYTEEKGFELTPDNRAEIARQYVEEHPDASVDQRAEARAVEPAIADRSSALSEPSPGEETQALAPTLPAQDGATARLTPPRPELTTEPLPAEVRTEPEVPMTPEPMEPLAMAPAEPTPTELRAQPERRQVPDASGAEDRRLAVRRQVEQEHPTLPPEAHEAIATERIKAQDARRVDPLTGLRTLAAYRERFPEVKTGSEIPKGHAVTFLDLKGFKEMNDTIGHDAADKVLQHVGSILSEEAGPENAHRRSGDEFFAVHPKAETRAFRERLKKRLASEVVTVENSDGSHTTVADGIKFHVGTGDSLAEADTAANASRARTGRESKARVQSAAEEPAASGRADRAHRPAQAELTRPELDALEAKRAARKTWVGGHSHGNAGSGEVAEPRLGKGARMAPTEAELTEALRDSVRANGGEPVFATAPTFYSQLERVASKLPQTMNAPDLLRFLQDPKRGIKGAELKWSGLDDFLRAKGSAKVTPAEVQEFLKANRVEIKEVTLRDGGGTTKFSGYQLPGGENYRELLLTLPKREDGEFQSSHFDQPNILAHVRFNERTDSAGKRVLFIEEVQSDWAQKGRREGFDKGDIHSAPFVGDTGDWSALAMKRMIRYAAENGFDRIAWTKGEQQAERYDLSKHIDRIKWYRDGDTYRINAEKDKTTVLAKKGLSPSGLAEAIGKDAADRIIANEEQNGRLEGLDLRVGGEGMRGFYDKILPEVAGKLGKKFGAKVGETRVDISNHNEILSRRQRIEREAQAQTAHDEILARGEEDPLGYLYGAEREKIVEIAPNLATVHSMDITPEMRRSVVEEGQPLFATGKGGGPTVDLARVRQAFRGAEFREQDGNFHGVIGGEPVIVEPDATIHVLARDLESAKASAAAAGGEGEAVGVTYSIPGSTIVKVAKGAGDKVIDHEAWHVAMRLALSEPERRAVLKSYGFDKRGPAETRSARMLEAEERSAEAYSRWTPEVPNGAFVRVMSFFRKMYRSFFPDAETMFGKVRSGEAFSREPKPDEVAAPDTKFATKPKAEESKAQLRPIDLEKIGTDETVKQALARVAKGVPDRPVDKAKLATDAGLTPQQLAALQARHGDGTARHIEAGRQLREASAADVKAKAEAIKDAPDKLQAEHDFATAVTRAGAITAETTGSKNAKAAAAIHKMMAEGLSPTEELWGKMLRATSALDPKNRAALLKAIDSGDQRAIIAATDRAMKPGGWDKFMEYWYNSVISGPPTALGNISGNAGFGAWLTGESGVAGLIDSAVSKMRGTEQERFVSEMLASAGSIPGSLPRAFKAFTNGLLREGGASSKLDARQPAILGKLGEVVRAPSRFLQASDDGAKVLAFDSKLAGIATRMAKREAIKSGSHSGFDARVEELINSTKKHGEARIIRDSGATLSAAEDAALKDRTAGLLWSTVDQFAKEATFQDEVGKFTKVVNDLRQAAKPFGIPVGNLVVPFTNVVSRILAQAGKRTPLGFIEAGRAFKRMRSGEGTQGEFSEALAKPLVGTMAGLMVYSAARQGMITGGGPADDKQRRLLEATGWQPYSVKIGKDWFSYKRTDPLATVFGIAADLAEAKDEKTAGSLADKLHGALIAKIADASYVRGLTSAMEAISDPKRNAARYIRDMEGTLIPNIVKKTAQAVDPTVRDTRSPLGPIVAGIPGLSQTLPARQGVAGGEQERPSTAAERFLSPFPRTEEKADAGLERALLDIDYAPMPVTKTLSIPGSKAKIELTDKELALLQEADSKTEARLRKVVESSGWRAMSTDDRKEYVEKAYALARKDARLRLYSLPSVNRRAHEALKQARMEATA